MVQLSSSGITIYDLHKKVHVYTSSNFYKLFDYDICKNQTEVKNEVFDRRIHPEDLKALAKNGFAAIEYLMSLSPEQRMFYKMINEYRILSKDDYYVGNRTASNSGTRCSGQYLAFSGSHRYFSQPTGTRRSEISDP